TQRGFILDQQDPLVTTADRARERGIRSQRLVGTRQVDFHRRTAPAFAVNPHLSAALFDDSKDGRQPEAGAAAYFFGGEEWFEDAGLGRRIHTHPVVGDSEHDVATRSYFDVSGRVGFVPFDVGRFYGDAPAVRQGVAGVDDQVHQDLLELTWVGAGMPKIRGATQLDIDVLADDPTDHFLDSRHDAVQPEHLGLQHLL